MSDYNTVHTPVNILRSLINKQKLSTNSYTTHQDYDESGY